MLTPIWARPLGIRLFLLSALLSAAPRRAQADGMERVRTDTPHLRLLIAAGIERSPTFHGIIDRLEQSDLIVELQCGRFAESTLAGRTVFLSAQPTVRYVLVEINCPMTSVPALGTIGHELAHALEIASAPWVVDGETLARLYEQIGFPSRGTNNCGYEQYETADALEAGARVHHELFHPSEPTRRLAQIAAK
jgi:hypothetical protein